MDQWYLPRLTSSDTSLRSLFVHFQCRSSSWFLPHRCRFYPTIRIVGFSIFKQNMSSLTNHQPPLSSHHPVSSVYMLNPRHICLQKCQLKHKTRMAFHQSRSSHDRENEHKCKIYKETKTLIFKCFSFCNSINLIQS